MTVDNFEKGKKLQQEIDLLNQYLEYAEKMDAIAMVNNNYQMRIHAAPIDPNEPACDFLDGCVFGDIFKKMQKIAVEGFTELKNQKEEEFKNL